MIPLARRLAEFTPDGHLHSPHGAPARRADAVDAERAAEKLRDAFDRGREAGRLEEEKASVAKLAAERSALDEQRKKQREDWTAHQADRISQHITEALAAIETQLADSVAKIIEPFLKSALKQKAVGEFCSALREALAGNAESAVTITGPQDLLDAIAIQLGPLAKAIEFAPSETCAVSARLGMTSFEMELARWLAALEEPSS